jgi:hypothetical protein
MNELARSLDGAPVPYPDLYGDQLTGRGLVAISDEAGGLRQPMMADADKPSRDLTRQGNDQADATQPDIPPVSAER